jgi:hypothetical protein
MDEYQEKASEQTSDNSLESGSSVVQPTTVTSTDAKDAPLQTGVAELETPSSDNPGTATGTGSNTTPSPTKGGGSLRRLLARLNIYLLLFILLIIAGAAVVIVTIIINKNHSKPTIKTQTLSEDALRQLATSDVTVGQPKQILNVQSNAVFAGKVLINDSLEVAGGLQVGSSLSLPGINVAGNSNFDQVQINKSLSVAQDAAIQGQLTVQKSLSVVGGATFGGALSAPQLTANTLQLNGNLNLTHHITAGGVTPGRSNGGALGSGGTTSVSGSDSAGSVNINTGGGAGAGCFITVNFAEKYNATPHVLITPVGSAAAGLSYYINRSTTNFSICTTSTPPSNASFGFDYFVLD